MRATTLIEIMVVMLIITVVISAAFGGVDIVKRLLTTHLVKYQEQTELYSSHSHLSRIIERADSVKQNYTSSLSLIRDRAEHSELILEDSVLTVIINDNRDTIMRKVLGLWLVNGIESDTVMVQTHNITLYFPTKPNIGKKIIENSIKEEDKYNYDDKPIIQ